jgi:hypothetical protein
MSSLLSTAGDSASYSSRRLLGPDYNPDAALKPWILSDNYFLDKSPTADEVVIPSHMTGWLPFTADWPITGQRDDADDSTNYRTQKSPTYAAVSDLAAHQIPVNIVALTNRMDLKFGPKMNPYISGRRGSEYVNMCLGASGKQDRYEQGTIGYSMFDACHALLVVDDMSAAANSLLQKRGESVEFVLMEFSIHRHDTCWAPADFGGCRSAMASDADFAKAGMINVFVVDAEEPFYQAALAKDTDYADNNPFLRGQTDLGPLVHKDQALGSHLMVDGGTGRGMQIYVHELMHVWGIEHVAGSPGSTINFVDNEANPPVDLEYTTLSYPNCEFNSVGAWYCDEKYVSVGQCTEAEQCCGIKAAGADAECNFNVVPLPSPYSPTYGDTFTTIIDSWLRVNAIVPATATAPDDTCENFSDEYSCYGKAGCYFDQGPAACFDIPGYPSFPENASIEQGVPIVGDTANGHHAKSNVFPYLGNSGEGLKLHLEGGTCTPNNCCGTDCVADGYSGTDMWLEVWDEDMSERFYRQGGTGYHYVTLPSFEGSDKVKYNIKVSTQTMVEEVRCVVIDDWTTDSTCYTDKFAGKYTLTVTDSSAPGCTHGCDTIVLPEVTPGGYRPSEAIDPACWRGTCLQAFLMDDDYTVCSDMDTFKWCVNYFCGNGYSADLLQADDWKTMDGCLCDKVADKCTAMDNFANTGQFVKVGRADGNDDLVDIEAETVIIPGVDSGEGESSCIKTCQDANPLEECSDIAKQYSCLQSNCESADFTAHTTSIEWVAIDECLCDGDCPDTDAPSPSPATGAPSPAEDAGTDAPTPAGDEGESSCIKACQDANPLEECSDIAKQYSCLESNCESADFTAHTNSNEWIAIDACLCDEDCPDTDAPSPATGAPTTGAPTTGARTTSAPSPATSAPSAAEVSGTDAPTPDTPADEVDLSFKASLVVSGLAVPEAGSGEMEVLKLTFEKVIKSTIGSEFNVEVVSIGGVSMGSRRLRQLAGDNDHDHAEDAEVEFVASSTVDADADVGKLAAVAMDDMNDVISLGSVFDGMLADTMEGVLVEMGNPDVDMDFVADAKVTNMEVDLDSFEIDGEKTTIPDGFFDDDEESLDGAAVTTKVGAIAAIVAIAAIGIIN